MLFKYDEYKIHVVYNKFAWFPMRINNYIIWLEKYTIKRIDGYGYTGYANFILYHSKAGSTTKLG